MCNIFDGKGELAAAVASVEVIVSILCENYIADNCMAYKNADF